jgi:hypothetical protein
MITGKSITDQLHIVAAVNDEEILANNLARCRWWRAVRSR